MAIKEALPALATFVPDNCYFVEGWLAIERVTGEKYEYHAGRLVSVRAMAGGTFTHAVVGHNLNRVSFNALQAAEHDGCTGASSDLRVYIPEENRYLYPALTIVCESPEFDTTVPSAVVNPLVVFEVTSPSSREYDENLKFDFYSQLPSLREYVIVSQARRRAEVRSREQTGEPWHVHVYTDANPEFALASLPGASFPFADVYRNREAPGV